MELDRSNKHRASNHNLRRVVTPQSAEWLWVIFSKPISACCLNRSCIYMYKDQTNHDVFFSTYRRGFVALNQKLNSFEPITSHDQVTRWGHGHFTAHLWGCVVFFCQQGRQETPPGVVRESVGRIIYLAMSLKVADSSLLFLTHFLIAALCANWTVRVELWTCEGRCLLFRF